MAQFRESKVIRALIARGREARDSEFREDGRDFWEKNADELLDALEELLGRVKLADRYRKRQFAQRSI